MHFLTLQLQKEKTCLEVRVATLLTADTPLFPFVCVAAVPKLVSKFALLQLTVCIKVFGVKAASETF